MDELLVVAVAVGVDVGVRVNAGDLEGREL